jgi:hypothetical protein
VSSFLEELRAPREQSSDAKVARGGKGGKAMTTAMDEKAALT